MNRILIVGISGTGKTYVAKRMAEKLKLPLIHLDSIFWKEGWQEQDERRVAAKVEQAISNDKWIIEGYIEPLGRRRVQRADLALYLDYPGLCALKGGLERSMRFHGKVRPEMPAGNTESLGFNFLWTVFRRKERPEIERAVKDYESKVIRLTSRKQTEEYLWQLTA